MGMSGLWETFYEIHDPVFDPPVNPEITFKLIHLGWIGKFSEKEKVGCIDKITLL